MNVSLQLPDSLFRFVRDDNACIETFERSTSPVDTTLSYTHMAEHIYFRYIRWSQKSIEKLFFMNQWNQLTKVIDHIPAWSSVLMIGPGNGFGSLYLQKAWYQVSNIDIADSIHPQLRHIVSTEVYDGYVLPYTHQAFDTVIAMYVLHHIWTKSNILPFLQEMKRVSKKLIIIDESRDTWQQKLQLFSYDLWYNLLGNWSFTVNTNAYLQTWELAEMLDKIGCKQDIYEEGKSPRGEYNLVQTISTPF